MNTKSHLLLSSMMPLIVVAVHTSGWRPIKSKPDFFIGPTAKTSTLSRYRPQQQLEQCVLHKVSMDQYTFPQYIQYKHKIPDLKQFTLCHWHKFYNHSREQTFFSYSLPHQPKSILSWISNQDKRSYYMLVVNGHTIHRLNYPIKLFNWYHCCQSWNGKTGEWQVWVNNERIGRGYYNLLVGHTIKGGGIAITGQEQRIHGGGFDIFGKSGLQGELTLLQLYKAALTAGKAYINHKHHHVNDYTHDDDPNVVNAAQQRNKRNAVGIKTGNPSNPRAMSMISKSEHTDQSADSFNFQNVFLQPPGNHLDHNNENQVSAYLKQDFIRLLPTYEEQQFLLDGSRAPALPPQTPTTSTQTEPAEWEVSKILQSCSSKCLEDAFKKANVMSWQDTPKKLFAGVSYPKAEGTCYNF